MKRIKKSYKIIMATAVPLMALSPITAFLEGLYVVRM
jgi:hypothetical protein